MVAARPKLVPADRDCLTSLGRPAKSFLQGLSKGMDVATAFTLMQLAPGDRPGAEDARRAFRRLALEVHPDKNPSGTAAEEFALLQEAHETVQAYIASCADAPAPVEVVVSPQDVCKGVPVRHVDVEARVMCTACHGVGAPNPRNVFECIECKGTGCPSCAGLGRVPKRGCACRSCHGLGRVAERRRAQVRVPVGARDGDELARGVVCRHRSYDGFRWRVEGEDLLIELDVTVAEALRGLSRSVETCRGLQTVSVDAPVDLWRPVTLHGHGLTGTGCAVISFKVTGWGCPAERLRTFAPALRRVFGST